MATTVKRRTRPAATKDAAPAKAPAKAKAKSSGVTAELTATADRAVRIKEQTATVLKMRAAGNKWEEIGEAVGITPGRAIFLHDVATVADEDKIKFRNDDELSKKLLKLRPATSWGKIAARTGVGEGKLKALYVAAGGDLSAHVHAGNASGAERAPRKTAGKPAAPKAARTAVKTRAKKA